MQLREKKKRKFGFNADLVKVTTYDDLCPTGLRWFLNIDIDGHAVLGFSDNFALNSIRSFNRLKDFAF